ncbi:GNAT family N-acetyltransferase [Agarivorans aestuarii]|uniref:GNAT family N-acetyltransferase n=1 Tax=Agarivorans aestuarii TaxID=1563703 RepID=A0ABU7G985_9ALTE|nr:GNAT family N-acetyltransferase [Agarivorans aestuarii]MEE1675916.1 GNAT family N-acetyltransferase [Agarivorans aestuarii]
MTINKNALPKHCNYLLHSSIAHSELELNASSPFHNPVFLRALEQQVCVGANSGWQPHHIELPDHQLLFPSYLKSHSYGEYVFDWAWADAYQRYGLEYYPKLVTMQPFTPIAGQKHFGKALTDSAVAQLADSVVDICQQQHLSSWHCNFIEQTFAEQLQDNGMMTRHGVQFEWHNQGYASFEDYLTRFTSRKRKTTNKERRVARSSVDEIVWRMGKEINDQALEAFYFCYQTTYMKRGQKGYLSLSFFQQLAKQMSENMLLVTAEKDQKIVASALFFFDQENLYGRYWGCLQELDMLHFELCFYQGIEFAIAKGIQRFNPGTQGEHKLYRGFEPVTTYSSHYVARNDFSAAINAFCIEEQQYIAQYAEQCKKLLPFKTQP